MTQKTVKQIIEECNSKKKQPGVNFYSLCGQFDIDEYYLFYDWKDIDNIFSTVTFDGWVCWDTAVGRDLVYFNNEPVAITYQPFCKSDVEWHWLGEEKAEKVYKYLESLVVKDWKSNLTIIDEDIVYTLEGKSIGTSRASFY